MTQSSSTKNQLLTRAVDTILPSVATLEEAMKKAEAEGRQLRGYYGVDPTSPHLHIGHTVPLGVLARFQQAGHKAILLIGDFTARLGDPDKLSIRPPQTKEQVQANMATYLDQVKTILDFEGQNPIEVRYNSEWSDSLTFEEIIKLAANFTVQQMLERDMFQKRIKEERPISLSEFFYPLMQGYDAVALKADVQFGGSDQLFNMLAGRTLNRILENREMFVVASPLLADGQGVKIGKTMGNAINIDNPPNELYGQMMSLPDEVIVSGMKLLTDLDEPTIAKIGQGIAAGDNPMQYKKKLTWLIVAKYHGPHSADSAQAAFEQIVQGGAAPDEIEDRVLTQADWDVADLLVALGLTDSKAQGRRLLEQGGIEVNNQKLTEKQIHIDDKILLKVGKRNYLNIHVSKEA